MITFVICNITRNCYPYCIYLYWQIYHVGTTITVSFKGFISITDNREKIRTIAKEQLEKLQICKMSYIQEYTCEFEEYYYKIFDSSKEMEPYLEKYYKKLPGFWEKYFREEYEKEDKEGSHHVGQLFKRRQWNCPLGIFSQHLDAISGGLKDKYVII